MAAKKQGEKTARNQTAKTVTPENMQSKKTMNIEMRKEFLKLFALDWYDDEVIDGFRELWEKAKTAEDEIATIIEARLIVQKDGLEKALEILEPFVAVPTPLTPFALLMRGRIYCNKVKDYKEALNDFNTLSSLKGQMGELENYILVLKAYFEGITLGEMKRHKDEINVYERMAEDFSNSQEETIIYKVAEGLLNKGVSLSSMGKEDEAYEVFKNVIVKFSHIEGKLVESMMARALYNIGAILNRTNSHDESLKTFSEVISKYGHIKETPTVTIVARAFFGKVILEQKLGKNAEALKTLYEISRTFADVKVKPGGFLEKFFILIAEIIGELPTNERNSDEMEKTIILCKKKTSGSNSSNLAVYLALVKRFFDDENRDDFFRIMSDANKKTKAFLLPESNFVTDYSFLLVLREWNSYTPALPAQEEADRGGGYFFQHDGEGVVIDPGYDFIENFSRAGGRMCDIKHIIITHAHDDHTAEFESLLMLAHRRWKEWEEWMEDKEAQEKGKDSTANNAPVKKIRPHKLNLYISASVQRKFSGLLDNRNPMLEKVVTLCPPKKGERQKIMINAKTSLTVLPAYHDDVISTNQAVGLCFDFTLSDGKKYRRVLFTGDTGLYPKLLKETGKPVQYIYTNNDGEPQKEDELDDKKGNALYEQYENVIVKKESGKIEPDLLVAHIGSIKEKEFPRQELTSIEKEMKTNPVRRFYTNHLGLLGTLVLLDKLNPKTAIISEFGAEMKKFRIKLVELIAQALEEKQKSDGNGDEKTFVIPGDITLIYDLEKGRFLCHETCSFDECKLQIVTAVNYAPRREPTTAKIDLKYVDTFERVYLFTEDFVNEKPPKTTINDFAWKFCRDYYNHELCIHKPKKI